MTFEKAKRNKIKAVKIGFLRLISDEFSLVDVVLRCVDAIAALGEDKPLPAKFTNMRAKIEPYRAWRTAKIDAIKACTTIEELKEISVRYP